MRYKTCFVSVFLFFLVSFLDVRSANACSCIEGGTVLQAYNSADIVVVTRVISVDRSGKGDTFRDVKSTNMVVEKVFKGNLKVAEEMTFAQGGGGDCIWAFTEDSIGKEFLFYLNFKDKIPKIWTAIICGRSNRLGYAADDMLYLNNLDKVQGKSRISGTVSFNKETSQRVDHRMIRIIGANKTYDLETDKNGVYEIYDLPAGKYQIEFDVPGGWKWPRYGSKGAAGDNGPKRRANIILESKQHAALDIEFGIDNRIRGTVYGPNGKPMEEVCVTAYPLQGERHFGIDYDYTNQKGNFEISDLESGNYVLVINDDGKITSREPFPKFYYPNVTEREKASIFSVREGEMIDDVRIYVSAVVETVTLNGILLYEDGKPVTDAFVQFEYGQEVNNVGEEEVHVKTDSSGHFSIPILKGTKGKLFGLMYSYVGKYENCPKLDRLVEQAGGSVPEIRTPAIENDANADTDGIKLKFTFPKCNKAKQPN